MALYEAHVTAFSSVLLLAAILVQGVVSTNSTSNGTDVVTVTYDVTYPTESDSIPEVVLTLIVIASCALLGLGIAKLSDYLYDRRMATKDDISNASEYTKNLLRARLTVMKIKPDKAKSDADAAKKKVVMTWIKTAVEDTAKKSLARDIEAGLAGKSTVNQTEFSSVRQSSAKSDRSPLPVHNKISPSDDPAMPGEDKSKNADTAAGESASPQTNSTSANQQKVSNSK